MREKKGEGRPSSATRENITLVDHRNLRNRSPFRPCTNLIRPMHGMRNDRVLLLCTYIYMYVRISPSRKMEFCTNLLVDYPPSKYEKEKEEEERRLYGRIFVFPA